MIVGPLLENEKGCEAILRSLPEWFGIEESLTMYARDSKRLPSFGLELDTKLQGFITLLEHFSQAWEVHCIAVSADVRGEGVGTKLLDHAESWLADKGVKFLQIKTIASTSPDPHYAATREFYFNRGYDPVGVCGK